jgi:putative MATE family efflux protein
MVGHVGKTELAAVGLGGILIWTIYSFFVGLSFSVSTFVAQSHGARNLARCSAYLWNGLYIGLLSGAGILLIRYFNPWTIDLLGPAPEVKILCDEYAGIRMLSGPFFVIQYTFSNYYRGMGNTTTPMKVMILANGVNIVLDYFLIFGNGPFPTLGVAGAAWATFVANVLSAAVFFGITFLGPFRDEYGTTQQWRFDHTMVKRLLKVGGPIAVHHFLDMGSFLVFSAYVGRMGTEQLAANQIVIQVLALSFMPCHGFSIAATTLMGQYIGAGRPNLAKKSAHTTLKLGLAYSGIIGVIYVLFPSLLVKIFNNDPLVVEYGARLILIAAVFQLFDAIQMISAGALRGAGDTKAPMVFAVAGGWVLFLPLSFVFGTVLEGGVTGAWAGATLYVVFLGIAMFARLETDRWKRIRLEDSDPTHPTGAAGEASTHSPY